MSGARPARALPARVRDAVALIVERAPCRVLEVGCGSGEASVALLEALPATHVVAIDRSGTQVQRARARSAGVEARRIRIEAVALEDARAILGEADFDLVFAVNVNAFWTEPLSAFASVRALLSPGGVLVLVFEAPSVAQRARIRRELMSALADAGMTAVEHESRAPHSIAISAHSSELAARR